MNPKEWRDTDAVDAIRVSSTWRVATDLSVTSSQTHPMQLVSSGFQSYHQNDAETQTAELTESAYFTTENLANAPLPSDAFEFLRAVTPMVERALARNISIRAYDAFAEEASSDKSGECLLTLRAPEGEFDLGCSCVAWSCTGQVVCGSYAKHDHADWCEHRSVLAFWNTVKRGLNPGKPDLDIEVNACVTSIEFHPKMPAVIAGGTFNGVVMVWDTSKEDEPLIASSPVADFAHKEPIYQLCWIPDNLTGRSGISTGAISGGLSGPITKHLLVSASGDGKVLVWTLANKLAFPIAGFALSTSSVPRKLNRSGGKVASVFGSSAISFSCEAEGTTFVAATESGNVLKCSTRPPKSVPVSGEEYSKNPRQEVSYPSPIVFPLEPHQGPVNAISCSPFHRTVVATCSADGSLRLYNTLQQVPFAILDPGEVPLFSVAMSPNRPAVLAVSSSDGRIFVYDFLEDRNAPTLTLETGSRCEVFSLAFNRRSPELLASGDARGQIKIWKLGRALHEERSNELGAFEAFARESLQADATS
eukprot:comp20893_c0_seq1/m.43466 comp20893_c0_seq1/g.43466  ORF comp20893_c0_seq1/g.43466 comp20893_c0_seq1/m.43466 type:complete len:533 (-) comp20893_c0_seq1:7-1605(-)